MATTRPAKAPAFQFYPGDWRRDTALQSCSLEARGLWWELLCVMHDGEPYGHLAIRGRPIADERAASMVGAAVAQFRRCLAELEEAGVSSRTEDGVLFSRRMVRDAAKRTTLAQNGSIGGQRTNERGAARYVYAMQRATDGAIKIGCSRDPERRLETLARNGAPLILLAYARGSYDSEKRAHIELAADALGGEWFHSTPRVRRWVAANLTDSHTTGHTTGQTTGPADGEATGPPADATADAEAGAGAVGSSGKESEENRTETDPQLARLLELLPTDSLPAFDGYRRTARFEPAYLAEVMRLHEPITGGPSYDGATIGRALSQMAANGEPFNASRLAGYCRRVAAGAPPTPSTTGRRGRGSAELAAAFLPLPEVE